MPSTSNLPPLRDRIRFGVRALFVGINPGIRSAQTGHHFAGYSNRFWKLLFESGLVPERITCEDDGRLPEWGYGITNLVARPSPGIGDLAPGEYEAGRSRLFRKVRRYRPEVVVLVGVTLYRALFPQGAGAGRRVAVRAGVPRAHPARETRVATSLLGLREECIGASRVFVLPNPSGRNANFSHAEMRDAFRALERYLG
jgi:TDG/mug DNA glycosylase family protein